MPILIAHGVRIYPWTTPAESTKMPTITPEGLIPAASLQNSSRRVEGGENAVAQHSLPSDSSAAIFE